MKLEIQSYKTEERPIEGQEKEFEAYKLVKTKTYECETLDQDMRNSPKGITLYKVILDDVELKCIDELDALMDFLKIAKKSFEI